MESMADLSLEQRNAALTNMLNDLTTVYEKCAAERDAQIESASYLAGKLAEVDRERIQVEMTHRRLFEDYERLQTAAENLANTVVAYFNKRGVAHAERRGNEDIAAMADALSDYGYQTGAMFARQRRNEWPAQRLDDAARVTEEP